MTMESGVQKEDEPPRRQDAKVAEPDEKHDLVARQIVESAFAVHQALGAGLLESVYEECLVRELTTRGIPVQRQIAVPVFYRGARIELGFRMDLVVNSMVVVEIKAIERLLPVHEAQLLTYLKLSRLRLGFLINFNVVRIRDGLRRMVWSF